MKKTLGASSPITDILLKAISRVDLRVVVYKKYGPKIFLRNDGQWLQEAVVLSLNDENLQITKMTPKPWEQLDLNGLNTLLENLSYQTQKKIAGNPSMKSAMIYISRKYSRTWENTNNGLWRVNSPTLVFKKQLGTMHVSTNKVEPPVLIFLSDENYKYDEIIYKAFEDTMPNEIGMNLWGQGQLALDRVHLQAKKNLRPTKERPFYLTTYVHLPLCMPFFQKYETFEMNDTDPSPNRPVPMSLLFREAQETSDPSFSIFNSNCYWGALDTCLPAK